MHDSHVETPQKKGVGIEVSCKGELKSTFFTTITTKKNGKNNNVEVDVVV